MIIGRIKSIVVTSYHAEDLHILDVRTTDLQQALQSYIHLCKQLSSLCSIV